MECMLWNPKLYRPAGLFSGDHDGGNVFRQTAEVSGRLL